MAEGEIQYVLTLDTGQAEQALQSVSAGARGLSGATATATSAAGSFRREFVQVRSALLAIGSTVAPQATSAILQLTTAFRALRVAVAAIGAVPMAALAAVTAAAAIAVQKITAKIAELEETRDITVSHAFEPARRELMARIVRAREIGRLSPEDAAKFLSQVAESRNVQGAGVGVLIRSIQESLEKRGIFSEKKEKEIEAERDKQLKSLRERTAVMREVESLGADELQKKLLDVEWQRVDLAEKINALDNLTLDQKRDLLEKILKESEAKRRSIEEEDRLAKARRIAADFALLEPLKPEAASQFTRMGFLFGGAGIAREDFTRATARNTEFLVRKVDETNRILSILKDRNFVNI